MAQTIGQYLHEAENYEFSKQAYELKKEQFELELMTQYLENQIFIMESAEDSDTFTEGYFQEAKSAEDVGKTIDDTVEKGKGFWATIWDGIKKAWAAIWGFVKRVWGAIWTFLKDGIGGGTVAAINVLLGNVQTGADVAGKDMKSSAEDMAASLNETFTNAGESIKAIANDGNVVCTDSKSGKKFEVGESVLKKDAPTMTDELLKILGKVYKNSKLAECGVKFAPVEKQPDGKKLRLKGITGKYANGRSEDTGYSLKDMLYPISCNTSVRLYVSSEATIVDTNELVKIFNSFLTNKTLGWKNPAGHAVTANYNKIKASINDTHQNGILIDCSKDGLNKQRADMEEINKAMSGKDGMNKYFNNNYSKKNAAEAVTNIKNDTADVKALNDTLTLITAISKDFIKIYNAVYNYKMKGESALIKYLAGKNNTSIEMEG